MNVALESRAKVWRGRGAPRKTIPAQIAQLADATYGTGQVGIANVADGEEDQAKELVSLLTSYANRQGKRMRVQREGNVIRFEMVDKRPYNKKDPVTK